MNKSFTNNYKIWENNHVDFLLQLSSDQLGDLYKQFIDNYPIVSIEDPYDQDDWEAYSKLTGSVQIQIVGSVKLQRPFLKKKKEIHEHVNEKKEIIVTGYPQRSDICRAILKLSFHIVSIIICVWLFSIVNHVNNIELQVIKSQLLRVTYLYKWYMY